MNSIEWTGEEAWVGTVEDLGPDHGRPPHDVWDEAFQRALDKVPHGAPAWYKVETYALIKHGSPGWLDGFRVILS